MTRRFGWIVVLWAVLSNAALAEPRQDQPKSKEKKTTQKGMLFFMDKEVQLSEEQQARLEKIIAENRQEKEAWMKENKPRRNQLMKEIRQARKDKDEAKVKELRAQVKALDDEQKALAKKHAEEVLAELTPEQQTKWKAFNQYRMTLGHLRGVKLTPDQKARIKTAMQQAMEQAQKTEDPKERASILHKARVNVHKTVLTDKQRQELNRKAKNKAKDKAKSKAKGKGKGTDQKGQADK